MNKQPPRLKCLALVLGLALIPSNGAHAQSVGGSVDSRMEQLCGQLEQGDATALNEAVEIITQLQQSQNPDRKLLRRNLARLVYASLSNLPNGPREEAFASIEKIERDLRTSFPEQSESDEALIHLAEHHTRKSDAVRIANELVARMSTPNQVRCRALALIQRYNLIGRTLKEVWPETVTIKGKSRQKYAGTVIYSWKNGSDASLSSLRNVLETYPKDTLLIGVNLDGEQSDGPSKAKKLKLPGIQLTRGSDLVSARFGLAVENIVIQTDENGTISSVDTFAIKMANAGAQ